MAKVKGASKSASSIKVNFGKRRTGKASKRSNKHTSNESEYRGQGR
jgi:hypothetical protein